VFKLNFLQVNVVKLYEEMEVQLQFFFKFGTSCKIAVTLILNPWSRVLLEKLTGFQLVMKFSAF